MVEVVVMVVVVLGVVGVVVVVVVFPKTTLTKTPVALLRSKKGKEQ